MTKLPEFINKIDLQAPEAYDLLFEAFTEQFPMPILTTLIKAKSFMFRIRQNTTSLDFRTFEDLLYPPVENVTSYSRANKPHQQIFYASDNFATTIAEMMPYWSKGFDVGDIFSMTSGMWELEQDILVTIIPDLVNQRLMELLAKSPVSTAIGSDLKYWNYINTFFHGQGFNDNRIYKVTSAFCNALIQNATTFGDKIGGVLYTSAQDPTGWNLALAPTVADNCLKLNDVAKHFIRKGKPANGKPTYDNYITPVVAKSLDYGTRQIKWSWYRNLLAYIRVRASALTSRSS
jgi:RES domain